MKREWYNPVVILKPDLQKLMSHITNRLPKHVQGDILELGINFMYDDRPLPIAAPNAEPGTNRIIIQDIHMAFLWCCSYTMVALNSLYYDKAMLDQDVVTFNDRTEMNKINITLSWARSLITEVTHWPDGAARPDKPDKWTESATNLFEACVAYILFHEIGHLTLHSNLKKLHIAMSDPEYHATVEDFKKFYDAEIEADAFALKSLIADSVIDDVLLMKYLGAALAQLSNFYFNDEEEISGELIYPDLDDRLKNVIHQTVLKREADRIQLQAHVSVGLQLFLYLSGKPFVPQDLNNTNFKDFKELEKYLFDLISQIKTAKSTRVN